MGEHDYQYEGCISMAASTRASRKQQTQKKFLEAIDRLLKGEAKCKSLKTMKLNNSNVEKEAGEKGNTIRHYPRVLDFISAKRKTHRLNGQRKVTLLVVVVRRSSHGMSAQKNLN